MKDVFLVVWSGGYDAPQYALRGADVEAWALAQTWGEDMREGEDTVDVLRIDLATMTVERLGSHESDPWRARSDARRVPTALHRHAQAPFRTGEPERSPHVRDHARGRAPLAAMTER